MPRRLFTIEEVDRRIVDPVTSQVVESLLNKIGVRNYFTNQQISITNDRNLNSPTPTEDGQVPTTQNRCDVRVEPIYNLSGMKWEMLNFNRSSYGISHLNKYTQFPVFADNTHDIRIFENTTAMGLDLQFSLKFKTAEAATKAFTNLNQLTHGTAIHQEHDIVYDYPIGMDLLGALSIFYKCVHPNKDVSFADFVRSRSPHEISFDIPATQRGVTNPTAKQLVIRRLQLSALGIIQLESSKPSTELIGQVPDRFVIEFTYSFQFSRPDSLIAYFPVTINNREVENFLITDGQPSETFRGEFDGYFYENSFTYFVDKYYSQPVNRLIRVPYYDDFNPPQGLPEVYGFEPVLIAAIILDDGDTTEIDLAGDLGDVTLHPKVLEIMKKHRSCDLFDFRAIYNVSIYVNNVMVDQQALEIDEDLKITLSMTDRSKRYHLVISEATSLEKMPQKWYSTLMEYRCFYPLTIMRNTNHLVKAGLYQIVPTDPLIDKIQRCMEAGTINTRIEALIETGHATAEIWGYSNTPLQLAEYLITEKSVKEKDKCLFEFAMEVGIDAGCIDENNIPHPRLERVITPFRGANYGHNTPLRVIIATIIAQR